MPVGGESELNTVPAAMAERPSATQAFCDWLTTPAARASTSALVSVNAVHTVTCNSPSLRRTAIGTSSAARESHPASVDAIISIDSAAIQPPALT